MTGGSRAICHCQGADRSQTFLPSSGKRANRDTPACDPSCCSCRSSDNAFSQRFSRRQVGAGAGPGRLVQGGREHVRVHPPPRRRVYLLYPIRRSGPAKLGAAHRRRRRDTLWACQSPRLADHRRRHLGPAPALSCPRAYRLDDFRDVVAAAGNTAPGAEPCVFVCIVRHCIVVRGPRDAAHRGRRDQRVAYPEPRAVVPREHLSPACAGSVRDVRPPGPQLPQLRRLWGHMVLARVPGASCPRQWKTLVSQPACDSAKCRRRVRQLSSRVSIH